MKENQKILILGGTSSAYLLGQRLKNEGVTEIYFSPGNAGTHIIGTNKEFKEMDTIIHFIREKNIDLTIIFDPQWLNQNLVNLLRKLRFPVLGPAQRNMEFVSNRYKQKEFSRLAGIPYLNAEVAMACEPHTEGIFKRWGLPLAIKTENAGEAVYVCHREKDWQETIDFLYESHFFSGTKKIMIEKGLTADEVTIVVASDKKSYKILGNCQLLTTLQHHDPKKPVTKGIAACSPAPCLNEELINKIEQAIIEPYMNNYMPGFMGFLSFKCFVVAGDCFLVGVNFHLSDIEATVLLPRLTSSLFELLTHMATKTLHLVSPTFSTQVVSSAAKVLGRLENYRNIEVGGLNDSPFAKIAFGNCQWRHGTCVATAPGSILYIMALGETVEESLKRLYSKVRLPNFFNERYHEDLKSYFLDTNYVELENNIQRELLEVSE